MNDNDQYLPLSDLKVWIVGTDLSFFQNDDNNTNNNNKNKNDTTTTLSSNQYHHSTWTWLEKAEIDRIALQQEIEEQGTIDIFANDNNNNNDIFQRVHTWTSSRTQPDGIGGYELPEDKLTMISTSSTTSNTLWNHESNNNDTNNNNNNNNTNDQEVTVIYVVSEQGGGFGDIVWASSRWLANLLAYPETCQNLLLFKNNKKNNNNNDDNDDECTKSSIIEQHNKNNHHPLQNVTFLELGAGAAIPSLVAMQCGAKVLCTDQAIPDRIRCMAEGMERTRRHNNNNNNNTTTILQGQVLPYGWGETVDTLLEQRSSYFQSSSSLVSEKHFRVIVAADCCYMPWLHHDLLSSIQQLLDPKYGVALLTFALHGNTDHDSVWNIKQMAQDEFNFVVEQLPSQQLTPPKKGMGAQQGLVHVLRLTCK